MHRIYKIINKVNQKIYIGKTSNTLEIRWKLHLYHAFVNKRVTRLLNAMRKYGADAFSMEEIASHNSEDEINKLEKQFIEDFNSRNPEIGYNISSGGDGGHISDEHYKKMSIMKKGKTYKELYGPTKALQIIEKKKQSLSKIKRKYKPTTIEEKLYRSEEGKKRWQDPEYAKQHRQINKDKAKFGSEHHFFGKTHSKSSRAKIATARQGKTYEEILGEDKAKELREFHRQKMILNNPSKKEMNFSRILQKLADDPRINLEVVSKEENVCRSTLSSKLRKILNISNFQKFRQDRTDKELQIFFQEKLNEILH